MKLTRLLAWIDSLLDTTSFDDVANNGLQLARRGDEISKVAFAVDASLKRVQAAAAAGAELLVAHHGISWGGGIKRLVDGEYEVVKAAMDANLAIAAYHLPLDANRKVGNNWELARELKLKRIRPAFSYHGNVIGVIGQRGREKIGICSGGAGEFAPEAKRLGCGLYITGEASWGEVIAAENVGMKMECRGHYATETYGIKALMRALQRELKVGTVLVTMLFAFAMPARSAVDETLMSEDYVGAMATLSFDDHRGGGSVLLGHYFDEAMALELELGMVEHSVMAAVRGIFHFRLWTEWNLLFGCSRFDPFFTLGAAVWSEEQVSGPEFGVGGYWYLSNDWALRVDARELLDIDGEVRSRLQVALGLEYAF